MLKHWIESVTQFLNVDHALDLQLRQHLGNPQRFRSRHCNAGRIGIVAGAGPGSGGRRPAGAPPAHGAEPSSQRAERARGAPPHCVTQPP